MEKLQLDWPAGVMVVPSLRRPASRCRGTLRPPACAQQHLHTGAKGSAQSVKPNVCRCAAFKKKSSSSAHLVDHHQHKIYYDASSNENTRCKSSSGERMGKLQKILAWQLVKVRNKKKVVAEASKEGKPIHFASLMDNCHLKKMGVGTQFSEI